MYSLHNNVNGILYLSKAEVMSWHHPFRCEQRESLRCLLIVVHEILFWLKDDRRRVRHYMFMHLHSGKSPQFQFIV